MFHDPYNEELSWPRPVAYLLVDTGLPCMTSAFAVLFLALLRATQIELVSPSFQVKPFCNYYKPCCHSMSSFGGMLFGIIYVSNFSREITKCNYVSRYRIALHDFGLCGLVFGLVTSDAN